MSFQPISNSSLNAAERGDTTLLRKLFKLHIKTGVEDDNGNSALNIAVVHNQTSAVQILLQYGFDPNHQNKLLLTPLHQAVLNENTDILLLLLEHGAKQDLPNHEGFTPIQLCEPGSRLYQLLHLSRQGLLTERYTQVQDVPHIPGYAIPVPKVKSDKKGKKGKKDKKGKKKKK